MLLSEQERLLADEANSINDDAQYAFSVTPNTLIHSYGNLVVPKNQAVAFSFAVNAAAADNGVVYLKAGTKAIWSSGRWNAGNRFDTGLNSFSGVVYLPAGTYAMEFYGSAPTGASVKLQDVQIGLVNFNDLTGVHQTYSGDVTHSTTVRATPLGNLAKTTFLITISAETSGAETNIENVGDSLTNGLSIAVDGVQKDWTDRNSTSNTYAPAWAVLALVVTAGSNHTVVITKRNASTVVEINVLACPWLLTGTLDFPISALADAIPQGSTVYVTAEPLQLNPSKTLAVGKVRAVSFGATTDYYESESGADILALSYTFETVAVASSLIKASGLGGCISNIGADV